MFIMLFINISGKRYRFELHDEADIGFYLLVFDKNSGESIKDHLQDTLQLAMKPAEEDYGAQADAWQRISPK